MDSIGVKRGSAHSAGKRAAATGERVLRGHLVGWSLHANSVPVVWWSAQAAPTPRPTARPKARALLRSEGTLKLSIQDL
eukprot:15480903-Alexandrium_andersonii.AAC.1